MMDMRLIPWGIKDGKDFTGHELKAPVKELEIDGIRTVYGHLWNYKDGKPVPYKWFAAAALPMFCAKDFGYKVHPDDLKTLREAHTNANKIP